MAVLTPMKAVAFNAAEIAAMQAAGAEDAVGVFSTVTNELAQLIIKLQRFSANLPAGANLTAINAAITALS